MTPRSAKCAILALLLLAIIATPTCGASVKPAKAAVKGPSKVKRLATKIDDGIGAVVRLARSLRGIDADELIRLKIKFVDELTESELKHFWRHTEDAFSLIDDAEYVDDAKDIFLTKVMKTPINADDMVTTSEDILRFARGAVVKAVKTARQGSPSTQIDQQQFIARMVRAKKRAKPGPGDIEQRLSAIVYSKMAQLAKKNTVIVIPVSLDTPEHGYAYVNEEDKSAVILVDPEKRISALAWTIFAVLFVLFLFVLGCIGHGITMLWKRFRNGTLFSGTSMTAA